MKVPYIFVIIYWYGVLAQLVERYTGSVEVSGSNPLCSTRKGTAFCGAFFRWSIMVVRKAAVRARSFSSAALPRGPFGVSAETAMHFCGAFFR